MNEWNETTLIRLEYDQVKIKLREYAMSAPGKSMVDQLSPVTQLKRIALWQDEADEACGILKYGGSVPIPTMEGLDVVLELLGKGYLLSAADLGLIGKFIEAGWQMKRYMKSKEQLAPRVSSYAQSFSELKELSKEIVRCIRNGQVADQASGELFKIRKAKAILEERMRKKLDGLAGQYRSYLQEAVVSVRGDRYVLPVKREHRKKVAGSVLDESASGQTVFIEPAEIGQLQQELRLHAADEAREEAIVLGRLTELTESFAHELSINYETFGAYDFLFAKAKYGYSLDARSVSLNENSVIDIRGGRHPLLGKGSVPLDFRIGEGYRALMITGPNTGGKTVSLKTVGLLTLMVQSGLLVPVDGGSVFAVYRNVTADIGDGQSIEQSLSTFSSHIRNVKRILDQADSRTLVLLDELAAGTDPGEGVGLSIAILEELNRRRSTIVATTHFNEIKRFAEHAPGFQNARMEFDESTLRPLYRLSIGEAGSSYALDIASQLGIHAGLITRARELAGLHKQADWPVPTYTAADPAGGDGLEAKSTETQLEKRQSAKPRQSLEIGDCVWIPAFRRTGIICSTPDNRGRIQVMIQKEKVWINWKRLTLHIEKSMLYPEGEYDMDIVLESKDTRKKRNLMKRKHVEGLLLELPDTSKE